MSMTDDERQEALRLAREARERAEAATPGPWFMDGYGSVRTQADVPDDRVWGYGNNEGFICVLDDQEHHGYQSGYELGANADHIARARSDVPALADAVEALAAENEELRTAGMVAAMKVAQVKAAAEKGAEVVEAALAERDELAAEVERLRLEREPSQAEADQAFGDADEGFLNGWTCRRCIDCRRWVFGGPTRCVCCAKHDELRAENERLRGVADRAAKEADALESLAEFFLAACDEWDENAKGGVPTALIRERAERTLGIVRNREATDGE